MLKISAQAITLPIATLVCLIASSTVYAQNTSIVSSSQTPPITSNTLSKKTHLTVHKDPNCGCCKAWVKQLSSDMSVAVNNLSDVSSIKDTYKISFKHRSCHTAVTDSGYIFEGHVPNTAMASFLTKPPSGALGLAVPGMPIGSPGMEVGNKTMRYPIYLLGENGSSSIYAYATGSIVEKVTTP